MKYTKLNIDWNAEPNDPDPKLSVDNDTVTLDFYLNHLLFDRFKEDQRGKLIFKKCRKYSFNTMNDEGYYAGQYRFKVSELHWGEFYNLEIDWKNNFHSNATILNPNSDNKNLKHYIFFLRDNTFECVAENYEFLVTDL